MGNQLFTKDSSGKTNIFPKNFIENIRDKESGMTLSDILQGFNCYFLTYTGNTQTTRLQVPRVLRRQGLWITYINYKKQVVTEWYDSDKIDDANWGESSNWRLGSNILVGDVNISSNGNWVINGVETQYKAQGERGLAPRLRISDDKYQASYDEGNTWEDISSIITNNLRISRYIGADEALPTQGILEGTIYAKGPYYKDDDTLQEYPTYRIWVYSWKDNTLAWQDNGTFSNFPLGVVQEAGNSKDKVMSQDAVTKLVPNIIFLTEEEFNNLKNPIEGAIYATYEE